MGDKDEMIDPQQYGPRILSSPHACNIRGCIFEQIEGQEVTKRQQDSRVYPSRLAGRSIPDDGAKRAETQKQERE